MKQEHSFAFLSIFQVKGIWQATFKQARSQGEIPRQFQRMRPKFLVDQTFDV